MTKEDFDDEPELDAEVEEFDQELELDEDVELEATLPVEVDDDVEVVDLADDDVEEEAAGVVTPPTRRVKVREEEDDDVVDLDEELHPDDVEEPLDVLLAERTASERLNTEELEDGEDEEEAEPDDRGDGSTRITPRRADEFLCTSCFLVLPLTQLADEKRQLCRDCV